MILLPPGSAKSTVANVQFLTWCLARDPREQILAVSHGESLAESFARRKRLVLQEQRWQALADTTLADDQQSLHRFATAAGGAHVTAGVGSAITGLRASIGVIDDPVSGFEVALSSTQLSKIVDWHDADYRSRLLPDAIELVITTRWARGDLAGVLLDRHERGEEDWTIVRLPMLADSDDDPMGRTIGEPLWPDWFTVQQVTEAQRDPLRWACLYQQTPFDDAGKWVPPAHLHYIDTLPQPIKFYAGVDLALTIGRGDWSVIVVAGMDRHRDLVIADVWRKRVEPNDTAHAMIELCERYDISEVCIDDDNASKVFRHVLIEACRSSGASPPPLNVMPMRGRDKETRAAAIRGLFLSDRVKILRGAYVHELVQEILRFPPSGSGHDDQVDALGLLGRLHAMRGPASAPKSNTAAPFRGQVLEKDGRYYLRDGLDDLFHAHERGRRRDRIG